ncbi:MAG: DUF2007 domain-containing protein [Arenicellales bacterium]
MIKVYSAQNAVDAHIIKGLLEQQGISARVNGEYLQGGIGELPLIDLVTVSVDKEEYSNALRVLREYEDSGS